MDIKFKYLCTASNDKGVVKLLLDDNNQHVSFLADGVITVDEIHNKFLSLIGFDPKFLKPVLLDVLLEDNTFSIYYGVLFPSDLEVKAEGFSFRDAKPLNLDHTQLRLLYLTMAKGLMP